MSNNYSAWGLYLKEFYKLESQTDMIKFLVNFAILAPSSHNSQPWMFVVDGDVLLVVACIGRALPVSDPSYRQLYISIGCAIENVLMAADYYGMVASPEYFSYGGIDTIVAKIKFSPALKHFSPGKDHLAHYIPQRFTDRGKYSISSVRPLCIYRVARLISGGNIKVDIVSNEEDRRLITSYTLDALNEAMSRDDFRLELSKYVTNNYTQSNVGMPGFPLGVPGPVSLKAPKLIKHFNLAKLTRSKDEELLMIHTPMFGIISTAEDEKNSWVRAGQAYQRMALEAERIGLRTAVMAAPIEIGKYYQGLQDVLGTK